VAVTVSGAARPIGPDREGLWFLGLVGFLLVPVALAAASGLLGQVLAPPVEFHVADDAQLSNVSVQIDRVYMDGSESGPILRTRVGGESDAVVYRTRSVGFYRVELAAGGAACTRAVSVRRADGSIEATVRPTADGGECPVSFNVR
jgi:hypothetical protein